jgi:hypothetical protein
MAPCRRPGTCRRHTRAPQVPADRVATTAAVCLVRSWTGRRASAWRITVHRSVDPRQRVAHGTDENMAYGRRAIFGQAMWYGVQQAQARSKQQCGVATLPAGQVR